MRQLARRQRDGSKYGFLSPDRIPGLQSRYDAGYAYPNNQSVYMDSAVQFTARDKAYLSIADADQTGLDPLTSNFSISLWIKTPAVLTFSYLFVKASGTSGYLLYFADNGTMTLNFGDGTGSLLSAASSAGVITAGAWQNITLVCNRTGNAYVYRNANSTPIITLDISSQQGSINATTQLRVGADNTETLFCDCAIDSFGFWNKALSAAEVTSLYNSGAGKRYADLNTTEATSLVSWWDLSEECYSDDTEIMTEDGWKFFADLQPNDKVATLSNEGFMTYETPQKFISFEYRGKMFHQKSKGIDLLVTPQHQMIVRKSKTKETDTETLNGFERIMAQDLPKQVIYKRNMQWKGNERETFTIPALTKTYPVTQGMKEARSENAIALNEKRWRDNPSQSKYEHKPKPKSEIYQTSWSEKQIPMDKWLSFFGIWLAEGCTEPNRHRISISQSKKTNPKKYEIIKQWIIDAGFTPYCDDKGFSFNSVQLSSYLRQFGKSQNKFIPKELKSLSPRQLKILIDAMLLGDGHKKIGLKKGESWQYATSSKILADDFQEIISKIGWFGVISEVDIRDKKYQHPANFISYRIYTSSYDLLRKVNSRGRLDSEWVDYDGIVYDLTVPNHTLYVRRNGKPVWSTNSGTRYDSKGTNHLSQTFVDIISPTVLNGGFETLGDGESLGSELLSNVGFEDSGTNGGLISGTKTSMRSRTSNVAAIVTGTPHGLVSTNVVTIAGMTDTTFNATGVAVTRIDDTTFTYANTGSDVGSGADTGGTITTDVFGSWAEESSDGYITKNSASPHGGTYDAKLTAGAAALTRIYQYFTTTASTRYKLTFWTKGDGTNAGVYYVYDATNSAYLVLPGTTGVTSGTYTQVTKYFTTAAGGISTIIYLRCPAVDGGIAYFDDISIKKVTSDDVFGSWTETITGSSTLTANTSSPYAGTYDCKMVMDAAGSFAIVSQGLLTAGGHKYKTTFYAKSDSVTPSVYIYFGTGAAYTQAITTTYTAYTVYGSSGTSPTFSLYFGTANRTVYFDNVTLTCTEIPSAAGIASGLAIDGNLCASFNGSTQYLTVANNAKLQTGDIDFEINGWVNFASLPTSQAVASKWGNSGVAQYEWLIQSDGSTFRFYVRKFDDSDLVYVNSSVTLVTNTWYFFRCYHNASTDKFGVSINNGTAVEAALVGGVHVSTSALNIGTQTNILFLKGRVDSFSFIKRILTASEATAIFNNGKGVKYAGLPSTVSADSTLVFYNLDEYSAGTGAVTRLDSTSNDMDLTDTGTTPSGQGVNYYEGAVSKILDISGNSKNLIQVTQANKLLYVTNAQNGKPVLRGDGLTKSIYNATDLIGTGNVTIFVVIKPMGAGGSNAGRIIDNSKCLLKMNGATQLTFSSDAVAEAASAASSIVAGTAYVVIVTRTSAGVANIYINGVLSGSADQASGTPAAGTPTYIGNNAAGARGFYGDIDEVGIYSGILTVAQITQLTTGLRSKWGI